jgi:RNA polymerase sigma factor (sigma-70 family)
MEPTDELLVQACARGEAAAWELLVERYKRLVYTIARRAGLDEEQSTDVFQRVFMILLERIDSIEQPGQIGAWFMVTARREAWRARRRESTTPLALGVAQDYADDLLDEEPLPDEQVQLLEQQHRVRVALEGLDERCRRLLTLLFLTREQPTYTTISKLMGMREGAIGPTRARCLQKLRRLLDEEDFT